MINSRAHFPPEGCVCNAPAQCIVIAANLNTFTTSLAMQGP